jgi:Rrf2 family iron-sulfur cluster assembly transcriptional regulator
VSGILQPSRKLLAAIEAVLDIAYAATDQPVSGQELTKRQAVPPRFLEPALQALSRAGILSSERGPRGGYRLARERRRITLGDICRAVAAVEDPEEAAKSALGRKVVHPLFGELDGDVMRRLDGLTLDDLCQKAFHQDVPKRGGPDCDFSI